MARRSLKALQSRLDAETKKDGNNNSGGFFYPHWNLPKDGITSMRITEDPDEENPLAVYVEYLEHKLQIGDEWVKFPCLKNNGKDVNCPVCSHSQKLYKAGDNDNGKYYYRDFFALLRGVLTLDGLDYPEGQESSLGKERPFKFSYQLAGALKVEVGKLNDDDLFWDLDTGFDFDIVKQMVKGSGDREYGKYDVGSGFARRATKIDKAWHEGITSEPLSALIPAIPTFDEAFDMLSRHLKAKYEGDDGSDGSEDNAEDEDAMMEKINRNRAAQKEKEAATPADKPEKSAKAIDIFDDDEDEGNVLESLDLSDDSADDKGDILSQLDD